MSAFKKIETKRKSTHVAEQILEAIRRGDYGVGEKLPPEREIAEQMDVSRPCVREALSALQLVGIVESRAGDGTYVLRAPSGQEEEDLALTLLKESPIEALEARRIFEQGIVRLAVEKMTPQALAEIRSALERMRQAAQTKDYDAYAQDNQDFHQAIARATGNIFIEKAILPLLEVMKQQLARELRGEYYRADRGLFLRSFELHEKIFLALQAGDAEAAAAAMDRHFRVIEDSLKELPLRRR